LASSIIDELEHEALPGCSKLDVYYFFFQHDNQASVNATAAYRSILAQYFWKHRDDVAILDRFAFAIDDVGQGQQIASESALLDLLSACLDEHSALVIDGVDECLDNDSLLKSLLRISNTAEPKILVLSRINVAGLKRSVPLDAQISFSKGDVSRDIRRFCDRQLRELFLDEILSPAAEVQQDNLLDCLVRGADGMFLWARLMFNFLRSPCLTPMQRLRSITEISFPEGLEKIYDRILSVIALSGPYAERLAAKVLLWLAYSVSRLSSRQIRQGLIVDGCLEPEMAVEDVSEFESAAIMSCAGLVERFTVGSSLASLPFGASSLRLCHLSVKEMVTKRFANRPGILQSSIPGMAADMYRYPHPAVAHLHLAELCLGQLLYHTEPCPLSGSPTKGISGSELHEKFCLTDYAAVAWLLHLDANTLAAKSLGPSREWTAETRNSWSSFARTLEAFLENRLLVSTWLESFYTATFPHVGRRQMHPRHEALKKWCSSAAPVLQTAENPAESASLHVFTEFQRDLSYILKVWGDRLRHSPTIIWDEMTVFANSRFFFSPGSTRLTFQTPGKPKAGDLSDSSIAMISKVSSSGDMKGVLNVWPPR